MVWHINRKIIENETRIKKALLRVLLPQIYCGTCSDFYYDT